MREKEGRVWVRSRCRRAGSVHSRRCCCRCCCCTCCAATAAAAAAAAASARAITRLCACVHPTLPRQIPLPFWLATPMCMPCGRQWRAPRSRRGGRRPPKRGDLSRWAICSFIPTPVSSAEPHALLLHRCVCDDPSDAFSLNRGCRAPMSIAGCPGLWETMKHSAPAPAAVQKSSSSSSPAAWPEP